MRGACLAKASSSRPVDSQPARGRRTRVSRDTLKLILALAAIVIGVGSMLSNRPVERAAGVLAPDDPVQQELAGAAPLRHQEYELMPRAAFSIDARVLSAERYRWDGGADLAPVDLAQALRGLPRRRVIRGSPARSASGPWWMPRQGWCAWRVRSAPVCR